MPGSSRFESMWSDTREKQEHDRQPVKPVQPQSKPQQPVQQPVREPVSETPVQDPASVHTASAQEQPREEARPKQEARPKPKTPRKGRPAGDDSQGCDIKRLPKSLVLVAKAAAPDVSNAKAVAAFLYAHRDPDLDIDFSDVPDDIVKLSKAYDRMAVIRSMDSSVSRILKKLDQLLDNADLERFVMTTLIMNANGLLGRHVSSGAGIDYTPPDFDLVYDELASHAEEYSRQKDIKNGRPIR